MGDAEKREFVLDIANEVARALEETHSVKCPHGYTIELRESLADMVKDWNELKPNLKIVSNIYTSGRKSTVAFFWGVVGLGFTMAFIVGVYETFQKIFKP